MGHSSFLFFLSLLLSVQGSCTRGAAVLCWRDGGREAWNGCAGGSGLWPILPITLHVACLFCLMCHVVNLTYSLCSLQHAVGRFLCLVPQSALEP